MTKVYIERTKISMSLRQLFL